MSYDTILVETDGPIATVVMNRPEAYNALNKHMRAEMLAALREVDADPEVRVCILKGAGKGFCAGNDLTDKTRYGHVSELIEGEYLPILELLRQSDKLFIAQVHGRAAGIGAAVAMSCDFVTMAEDGSIYMAFSAISLIPDGGASHYMMNALGYHRALEAVVEGCNLRADDCLSLGIANRVIAPDALEPDTRAWAESLTKRAPLATAAAKRILRSMTKESFGAVVAQEAQEQNALIQSKDFQRGVSAFMKRETPVFEGD